ncbi:MAG: M42 family metallopeptidase, partial [Bacteroidota bacterium]
GMFIDVAAGSREEAEAMGLGPGDPAVPEVAPLLLHEGACLMGKALDDRVGALAVIEAARRLRAGGHPNTVLAAGTVQEEVGARGARTAASMLRPEICLVVEGTPADDSPGFARDASQGALGRGPQIRLFDPSMIGHRPLIDLVRRTAEEEGLPYQMAVREGGGTDGGPIHVSDAGVPAMVIGIPVRYAHSQIGLCSLADLENAVALLTAVVRRLDSITASGLLA